MQGFKSSALVGSVINSNAIKIDEPIKGSGHGLKTARMNFIRFCGYYFLPLYVTCISAIRNRQTVERSAMAYLVSKLFI